MQQKIDEIENVFQTLITLLGDDPKRDGLLDTPRRIAESYSEILDGYNKNPKDMFKTVDSDYKGIVVFKDVKFYSLCEHHFLPVIGKADIGIIPSNETNKVIGFNKIIKLVDIFAHRLQIQERLTQQITDSLHDLLVPEGIITKISARHLCSEMRSVKSQPHDVVTVFYRGSFSNEKIRNEFYELLR